MFNEKKIMVLDESNVFAYVFEFKGHVADQIN